MAVVAKKKPKAEAEAKKTKSKGVGKDKPATKKSASTAKKRSAKASKKRVAKKTVSKKETSKETLRKAAREAQPTQNPEKHRKIQGLETGAPVETEKTSGPELDPFEIAKKTMKGSVPAIVEAMVEAAKQGSHTHAKTLLEMTGAKHMFDNDSEQDAGEPWAKLVLARLEEAESVAEKVVAADPKIEALEVAAE